MSKTTKNVLGESLKKLLQKKPLNKITVTELVDDCGMNRMTFYYHFKDIYDLLEWVCVEDTRKALAGMGTYANWQEGLYNIFELVLENKAFVIHTYRSMSREYLEMYIYRLTNAVFISVIEELDRDHALSDKDKEFIASFYKYAFLGIMLNWVDHDMQEDPKDIIERLGVLVDDDLVKAIGRFTKR